MEGKIARYENTGGPVIATVKDNVKKADGLIFKNLSGSEELLPYEDWRLDAVTRARDLASRMSVEEIVGLMMYSPHQMVPCYSGGPFMATYDGKPFEESGKDKWELSDQQKEMLTNHHIRHVLSMYLESAEIAAKWNNRMQAAAENEPWGIPVNFSSDPRHSAGVAAAEFKSAGDDVSKWPDAMGIAATFDDNICREYAAAIREEYRALGITTALSPQIDVATEPRWMRFEDTFGTNPGVVTRLGKLYCEGLQTTPGSDGWGDGSVCAMAKHWPGGGPCEAGRDAHYAFGKYAVYPGNNLKDHLMPFTEGAFKLEGGTKKAAAIMPYYTVSWNVDTKNNLNVGNSYSNYIIKDMLRTEYGYDGVVCTDWGITKDPEPVIDSFGSRCYGVENYSESERHLIAIENGVDQFGGNSDKEPILKAYEIGCEKYGENNMRKRMEESAVRLLTNIFRCGLFENPYLDVSKSVKTVGNEALCKKGYEAQLKSLVLIKNKNAVLPANKKCRVYIPSRTIKARKNFFRFMDPEKEINPVSRELLGEFFDVSDTCDDADIAVVFIESPLSDGYSEEDVKNGGNGYVPVSLMYRPYTAEHAREKSVAAGDFREEKHPDRSYKGKTGTAANEADLDLVINTKEKMKDKPVIVVIRMHNPTVMAELDKYADAVVVDFGVSRRAVLDFITGACSPCGRLPIQLPLNMETVEKHCEDTPFDMESFVDELGNVYEYGYGIDWDGHKL